MRRDAYDVRQLFLRRPDPELGSHGQPREPGTNGSPDEKARLLLVEDNEPLRRMLTWGLIEQGYRVAAAGSCREARFMLAETDFRAAILDVGLPDGDGIDLAGELASDYPTLGLVLCSGHHGVFDRHGNLPRSILPCLTKPVSLENLDRILCDQVGAGR